MTKTEERVLERLNSTKSAFDNVKVDKMDVVITYGVDGLHNDPRSGKVFIRYSYKMTYTGRDKSNARPVTQSQILFTKTAQFTNEDIKTRSGLKEK